MPGERSANRALQLHRRLDALSVDAERARQGDEVGIDQLTGDQPARERLLLRAFDVAERAIVEHDRHDVQPVLALSSQLADVVHEAAIARDGQHGPAGIADLRAERGGEG